jgi:hypothetical protein
LPNNRGYRVRWIVEVDAFERRVFRRTRHLKGEVLDTNRSDRPRLT